MLLVQIRLSMRHGLRHGLRGGWRYGWRHGGKRLALRQRLQLVGKRLEHLKHRLLLGDRSRGVDEGGQRRDDRLQNVVQLVLDFGSAGAVVAVRDGRGRGWGRRRDGNVRLNGDGRRDRSLRLNVNTGRVNRTVHRGIHRKAGWSRGLGVPVARRRKRLGGRSARPFSGTGS